jgi:hypothetical protein
MTIIYIECRRKEILRAAIVVDQVIPHKGNPELLWDQSS